MEAKQGPSLVITVRISLRHGRDDDLIALCTSAPRRGLASAIREAMRNGVNRKPSSQANGEAAPALDLQQLGFEL